MTTEIDELRAENELLRAETASGSFYKEAVIDGLMSHVEAVEAEIKRLLAEIERLRAERRDRALSELAAHTQAEEAYEARLAAEAENERLRAVTQNVIAWCTTALEMCDEGETVSAKNLAERIIALIDKEDQTDGN